MNENHYSHSFELQFTIAPSTFSELCFRESLFDVTKNYCEAIDTLTGYDLKVKRQTHAPVEMSEHNLPLSVSATLHASSVEGFRLVTRESLVALQDQITQTLRDKFSPSCVIEAQIIDPQLVLACDAEDAHSSKKKSKKFT